jgi:hypothetical protein
VGGMIRTRRLVVANGEDRRNIGTNIAEALRTIALALAVDSSTSDTGGTLPDDLGEVAPSVKGSLVVDAAGCLLAVLGSEVSSLVVVEQLSDNGGDVVRWAASSNVLAISTVIGSAVR